MMLEKLEEKNIKLHTNVDIIEKKGTVVRTTTGDFEGGMVVVSIGVKPNTAVFSAAGGELGVGGAVKVDRFLPRYGIHFSLQRTKRSKKCDHVTQYLFYGWMVKRGSTQRCVAKLVRA